VIRSNHLLPRGLLLRQRIQRLIERVRNNCAHGLVSRPIRVDIRLPEKVKERLVTILHGRESVIRDITGSPGRLGLAGREEVSNDPGTIRAVGVNPVGADCEGFIICRAF